LGVATIFATECLLRLRLYRASYCGVNLFRCIRLHSRHDVRIEIQAAEKSFRSISPTHDDRARLQRYAVYLRDHKAVCIGSEP